MEKKLTEITRKEWVSIRWIEVTKMGYDRTFVASGFRTPDEAAQAMQDWDTTIKVRETQKGTI